MYYYRLTFIVPLVLCLIHSLSSSFNHSLNQQSDRPTSSTLASSSSSSVSPEDSDSLQARTKPFLKQAIFNKGFGLLTGGMGGGGGCCPCSECCVCGPPLIPGGGGGPDYPDPGILEDPNGPGLFNRFGSTATLSSSTSRRVVRRRYVRPNGLVVVEIEEQPAGGFRGSGLFGTGLFSRFIPSALENGGNFSRRRQIVQPSINTESHGSQDRYTSTNNNQRRTRNRVNNQG